MTDLQIFSDEELAFICIRGVRFGKGCARQPKAEATEVFADGSMIIANMALEENSAEEKARKAADIFLEAAWAEWNRLNSHAAPDGEVTLLGRSDS